ncbi:unnamed protein product [Camellia sinensis]
MSSGFGQSGNFDCLGNESGYGSEPGYRGDAEFGYGDEFDEEEDDHRVLFWGEKIEESINKVCLEGFGDYLTQWCLLVSCLVWS